MGESFLRLLLGSVVVVFASLTSAQHGFAAEVLGSDPLFTAPPASLSAQDISTLQARLADFAQIARYRADDERLAQSAAGVPRVVFLGDSITEDWITKDWLTTIRIGTDAIEKDGTSALRIPRSADREYVNRGISGQTTAQMLLRFRQDVIGIHPAVVVILAGTNDIAGNTGKTTLPMIEDNLRSMVELAQANRIRVVLASLLPASDYPWRRGLQPAVKVRALNAWIERYAQSVGATYVDFHSRMTNAQGGMDAVFAADGVHPTAAGYAVMTKLAVPAIDEALAK
jgi:lysophospholipase L1-like esterase